MGKFYIPLLVVSALVIGAPVASNLYRAAVVDDWRASPRFNGRSYVVSETAYVPQELDDTGVAAVAATLLFWQGTPTTEAEIVEALAAEDFGYRLSDFRELASAYGLHGHWVEAEPAALSRLKVPFVAHLTDRGGRFVIVRQVRNGYLYVADPLRGNLLYPLAGFAQVWTGQAFAFPEPPAQPEEWR